jgi:hypothetical protein
MQKQKRMPKSEYQWLSPEEKRLRKNEQKYRSHSKRALEKLIEEWSPEFEGGKPLPDSV